MTIISFNPDPTLPSPLYRQLSDSIETAILQGSLKHGDRLPPTRQLSSDLKIARRTIVRAYDELLNKGYLNGRIGAGTTVNRSCLEQSQVPPPVTSKENQPVEGDSIHLSNYGKSLIKNCGTTTADDSEHEFDEDNILPELLPIKQWRQLMMRNCSSKKLGLIDDNSGATGYKPLRESVAEFLTRTKGVICHPDQVIVFNRPQDAIDQLIKIIVDPGDRLALEDPSSRFVRGRLRAHGALLQPICVDDNGMNTDGLESLDEIPKAAYLTPSCQYPTGSIMPHERRMQLLDWTERNRVLLIEDATGSDFRYGSQNGSSLQGLAPNNTIYIYGFHRTLFPLTSVTVLVVPMQMLAVAKAARATVRYKTDFLELAVLADFVSSGYLDAHLRKIRRIFQERRQLILYSLATCFWKAISISPRTSGLNVLVRFNEEFDEQIILKCARLSDLPMKSTRANYMHADRGNEFLIPFSTLTREELGQRLGKFASFMATQTDDNDCQQMEIDCRPA
jgi:GntR family transcriptional regulator / MocR family aminotransferase